MNKKKTIVIAGGGFAGLAACNYLYKRKKLLFGEYEVILIDRKKTFDFLPLAPDVLAGWLAPGSATVDLTSFTKKRGFKFINETVEAIDPVENILRLAKSQLVYDFAIIAVGSDVNFFGRKDLEASCLKLNSIQDAADIKSKIKARAQKQKYLNIIITGAGYTGIEVAMTTHYFLSCNRIKFNMMLVENRDSILFGLPERLIKIAKGELDKRKIEIILNDTVSKYEDDRVILGSGREVRDSVCIWSAGVCPVSFLQNLDAEKIKGRIKVDEKLNIYGKNFTNLFMAGDCCSFSDSKTGMPLRMAVMFSLGQAKVASRNIINSIKGKRLASYRPVDLGYLIPLTYHKAPGLVLGCNVGSRTGYLLHYCLCIYRSGISKKFRIIKDLILRRFLKLSA
ncbi:MAG: FAD-dependent oxidoreductase [Candidatus Omnitrophota bacterium]